MSDFGRRFLLYFRPFGTYWRLSDQSLVKVLAHQDLGLYPLDLIQRLDQGHYDDFDENGLPVRRDRKIGRHYYNYTTICSFALANWDKYLITGNEDEAIILLRTAQFICDHSTILNDGTVMLYNTRRENPRPSAMNQGEAISVLVRAWLYSRDEQYVQLAKGCVKAFTKSINDGGVAYPFRGDSELVWYEEYAGFPLRHVLNGMIYSLWGLRDMATVIGNTQAGDLFNYGLRSIEQALKYFDIGYWSMYCVPEKSAVCHPASIMYHNLHVVQLSALGQQTGSEIIQNYANRFSCYGTHIFNRIRAAIMLVRGKFRMRCNNTY